MLVAILGRMVFYVKNHATGCAAFHPVANLFRPSIICVTSCRPLSPSSPQNGQGSSVSRSIVILSVMVRLLCGWYDGKVPQMLYHQVDGG